MKFLFFRTLSNIENETDAVLSVEADVFDKTAEDLPTVIDWLDLDNNENNNFSIDFPSSNILEVTTITPPPPKKAKRASKLDFRDERMDLLKSLVNRPQPVDKKRDGLDNFFAAMCDTVRTFPPQKIAEAKYKISQLIGEMEMANFVNIDANNN